MLAGCVTAPVRKAGIRVLYDEVPPASERVMLDVPYRTESEHSKHRLDLFLPDGENWPALVFVHGGGLTEGDKSLAVHGADVYQNIGRFYASQGIGTAVINYRLQPEVTWREQAADVAHAVAWVRENIDRWGGRHDAIFLFGHSAGATLSANVALNPAPLAEAGLTPSILCGVIPVSGAAYDLSDSRTYELGGNRAFYESRFRAGDPDSSWVREASPVNYVTSEAPPFLLLHGSWEWRSLSRQNKLLDQALTEAGVQSELRVLAQTHGSMVLALSRADRLAGAAVLEFIKGASCRQSPMSRDEHRTASSRSISRRQRERRR
jgi:acetyl esterase/lipase